MLNDHLPLRYWARLLPILLMTLIFFLNVQGQQQVTVTGEVKSTGGEPLAGASVSIKGTSLGVLTNAQGVFSISCQSNSTLVFSFSGFEPQERLVSSTINWNIQLENNESVLGEVVVTALGINRQLKSITYASQKVEGSELTKVPQTNFMNALSGKVAGLTVGASPSGLGGSVKITLRGNKSIQQSNQPLYVIDGVPMLNVSQQSSGTLQNRDFGDGISNLNPADIESINVLKGASAAVLYGSQAANGVILITTKKGKAGQSKVEITSSATFDKVALLPDLQDTYAQTATGSDYNWGNSLATKQPNQMKDFFRTGLTLVNGVSLTSGSEKLQNYLSYSNTLGNSVIPNSSVGRHNFTFRTTSKYFNNKVTVDANANLIKQTMDNTPYTGQVYGPLWGLYTFPRGLDFEQYKAYEIYDDNRKLMTQNWWRTSDGYNQNPYWVANKMLNKATTNRVIFNIGTQWDINNWLNIQARGNVDRGNVLNTQKYYAGTAVTIVGQNGSYNISDVTRTQYYGDLLLNFNKSFNKLDIRTVLGSSIQDSRTHGESVGSNALYIPNVFNFGNINFQSANTSVSQSTPNHSQLQSVFGSLNLSFDNWLFLDVTGRNDWSSNLSFTPNGSYFYPSVGLSTVLNDVLNLPKAVSLAKLRASYAIVGNTVPNYVTNPVNSLSRGGTISFNTTAPFGDLKPEMSRSFEIGTDLRFLNDRLSVDFTYYKTNTINQFFTIIVPPGTGYSNRYINGGDIQNKGIEVMLGISVIDNPVIKWRTNLNFSSNKNVVKKLAPTIDRFNLSADQGFYSVLTLGGSYGDMYANVWDRDSLNRVKLDGDNKPIVKPGLPSFVGNANPKFLAGWSNNISFRDFTLGLLIDGRFGLDVMSVTQAWLDNYGVSKVTAEVRDKGGVSVNAINTVTNQEVSSITPFNWYYQIPYGESVFDSSVVRLREISLSWQLPQRIFASGFIKGVSASLIGRNLAYLYRPAPVDSEIAFSVGNRYAGLESFGVPPTRSFGFNVNIRF